MIPEDNIDQLFYGDGSVWFSYYDSLQVTIKDHYSTLACSDEIITLTKCAFSNLTNSQWLEADLL